MGDQIESYSLGKLPEEFRKEWSRLVEVNPDCRRAFLSPTFCDAVEVCGADVRVLTFSYKGTFHGLLPLQMKPGIIGALGIAERVGGEMSDYFGAVGSGDLRLDPSSLLQSTGITALEFSHLDEAQTTFGLGGESPRIGLCIDIGTSGTEYWENLREKDKKLTSDTERRARKLAANHGALTFELQSSQMRDDLELLIHLKKKQYLRTGRNKAVLLQYGNVELLRELLKASSPSCTGLLSVLRAGDRLVAAHFGLCCHNVLHYWFPVYDPEFKSYSPGRLLLMNLIRQGPDAGIQIIDRGEGDAPYKRDFANLEHRYYKGVWSADGVRGAVGRIALSAMWRVNARWK